MTQWELCELWYEQKTIGIQITLNVFSIRGNSQQHYGGKDWPNLLARLGGDGWQMVSVMASPTGLHQYWYYFKRQIA